MKPVLLADASVTRLYPITKGAINHLLPIYPTPMVHEPISGLMLAWESRMTNKKSFQINRS